jgi:hypothetical protein
MTVETQKVCARCKTPESKTTLMQMSTKDFASQWFCLPCFKKTTSEGLERLRKERRR